MSIVKYSLNQFNACFLTLLYDKGDRDYSFEGFSMSIKKIYPNIQYTLYMAVFLLIIFPGIAKAFENPSYDGSYNLGTTNGCQTQYYDLVIIVYCYQNQELVNGTWQAVSHSVVNKPVGSYTYRLKIDYNGRSDFFSPPARWNGTHYTDPFTVIVTPPDAPATPTGALNSNSGDYVINWNTVIGATSYELEEQHNAGNWALVQNNTSTSLLTANQTDGSYAYRVRACSAVGCSDWSGNKNIIVAKAPGNPVATMVSPMTSSDGNHNVSWGASSGTVTGYEVEQDINASGYGNTITTASLLYNYTNLATGDYVYRVRAYNTVSTYTSYSDWVYSSSTPPATVVDPVFFSISDTTISEGGQLSFTVTKAGTASTSYSVDYATADDSAIATSDYTANSGTLTFSNTETSKTVIITTIDDTVYEGNETVLVNLSNSTGGSLLTDAQGIGTITSDDAAPSFSIDNVQVAESGNLLFTVTKTGDTAFTHSIDYSSADATAQIADSDYTAVTGTLNFLPIETSKTISVTTLNEDSGTYPMGLYEGNEMLSVLLSNTSAGATITNAVGTGTIVDDDDIPEFVVVSGATRHEGGGILVVYVQSNGDAINPPTVDYSISPGTALPGEDYGDISGTLTFTSSLQSIDIPLMDNNVFEGTETLTVNISNPQNAMIQIGSAEATITDDLDAPDFSIDNIVVTEGDQLSFSITRSGDTLLTHTLDYVTSDVTATVADNDYIASSGTLNFLPSETSKTITITSQADTTEEQDETFTVDLSNITNGAHLFDPAGIGTLTNDDFIPLSPDVISIAESGSYDEDHAISWPSANNAGAPISQYELQQSLDGTAYGPLYNGLNLTTSQNNLADGTYRYRVRACNVSGCSSWQESALYSVVSPPIDPNNLFTLVPDPASFSAGVTAGEFNVDSSGSANYQIPITVPPGTAGMEPALALSYNHRSENALLGVGWTLGGLSVVTRCPATVAQDGVTGSINFDANDKFCIDGERLIAINGVYGADGTEYRTELDGFTRVTSYGTAGTGPEYFVAETKSGQTLYYGWDDTNHQSRIEAEGRADIRLWAVDRIEDTVGNYLTVSYIEDTFEYRPERIDYAGNTVANTSSTASVQFEYETRSDIAALYLAGSKVETTQRLSYIKTFVGSELVRDYQLSYDNQGLGSRSRLTQVQECAGSGVCFAPTSFTWQGDNVIPDFYSFYNTIASQDSWNIYNIITGDWNGDGRTDIFLQHKRLGISLMYTTNTDGTMSATGFSVNGWWAGERPELDYNTNARLLFAGDWNGDGKTDILRETINFSNPNSITHTLDFYHSTGAGFVHNGTTLSGINTGNSVNSVTVIGDWNADGRSDLFLFKPGANQMYTANASGNMVSTSFNPTWSGNLTVGDWNGDGQTDLLHVIGSTSTVYLSEGLNFTASGYNPGDWSSYAPVAGDYNGDGNTDIFLDNTSSSGSSHLYFSTGDGHFVDSGYSTVDFNGNTLRAYSGDWNGDGKADVMRTGGDLYIGTGIALQAVGFSANFGDHTLAVGDWNGDGLSDLLYPSPSGATQCITSHAGFDWLSRVTNGLGANTDISYEPITDSNVHTMSTGAVYPEIDMQTAIYVVDSVKHDNGVGSQNETTYDYAGARTRVDGRGFLGFASMTTTDVTTGIKQINDYSQSWPTTGMVTLAEQQLADNTVIGRVTNTYSAIPTHAGVEFPYASQVIKQDFELDGTLISTATTDSIMDSTGSPTSITVTTVGGGETFTTQTQNDYFHDETNWLLGRLVCARVTQTLPDTTTATRTSGFEYNVNSGLLTREALEPQSGSITEAGTVADCVSAYTVNDLALITDYVHDDFGNRKDVTVSGHDIISRTTTTTYDSQGQFPYQIENALGHVETREYDARYGAMTKLTGPNNLTTQWFHDDFGREREQHRADGTRSVIKRAWCDVATCPTDGVLKLVTYTIGVAPTVAISDQLGREIKTASVGFDHSVIETATVYDNLGRVDKKSRPYFAGTTPCTVNSTPDLCWHSAIYDDFNRPLTETAPDGSVTTTSYNGLSVSVTNDKNQTNTRINNALGQLKSTTNDSNEVTDYTYDPFGNLETVTVDKNGASVLTSNGYDLRGRKTSMSDPDMGNWAYEYNVLGELKKQTDAKGQEVTMSYDLLGRMEYRTEPEGTSSWFYDSAANGIGKLAEVTGAEGDTVINTYDSLSRPSTTTTWLDTNNNAVQDAGEVYTNSQSYDLLGRIDTKTYPASPDYPTGLVITHHYTVDGQLYQLRKQSDNSSLWEAITVNAEGQLTSVTYGNGVTSQWGYTAETGLIDTVQTSTPIGVNNVQNHNYDFDVLGNLIRRDDYIQNINEAFHYDNLNRLTQTDFDDGTNPLVTTNYQYDSLGNLTFKSDISSSNYLYGDQSTSCATAGSHAVTEINGQCYSYDANGNQTQGYRYTQQQSRTLTWTSYNKPKTITEGTTTLTFKYGAGRARFEQHNSGKNITTFYVGSAYEKEINHSNGLETHTHYIRAGDGTIAMIKSKSVGAEEARYLHKDHIGSISAITDETALVLEQLSFDAWGKRRNPNWQATLTALLENNLLATLQTTKRGFTGHEMLDDVGLIHMNGRVYDPEIGRFLSPDPFVQSPANTQNFNRYSYVLNNPLSATDPSGFFFSFFKKAFKAFSRVFRGIGRVVRAIAKNIRTIAAITSAAVIGPYCAPCAGAAAGLISSGGDLKTGIIGAVTGGALSIGNIAVRVAVTSIVGGIGSEIQGGNFLSGFVSGGFSAGLGATGIYSGKFSVAKLVVSSVAGGFVSVLGGGKFKNGAITGALAYSIGHGVEAARAESISSSSIDHIALEKFATEGGLSPNSQDNLAGGVDFGDTSQWTEYTIPEASRSIGPVDLSDPSQWTYQQKLGSTGPRGFLREPLRTVVEAEALILGNTIGGAQVYGGAKGPSRFLETMRLIRQFKHPELQNYPGGLHGGQPRGVTEPPRVVQPK